LVAYNSHFQTNGETDYRSLKTRINEVGFLVPKQKKLMKTISQYGILADDASLNTTFEALRKNNIKPHIVNNKKEALMRVMELIPSNSEVMNMTSMTVSDI
jgi:hypothetical protein